MKKYKTTSYDAAKITEVEALKETAALSGYHQYHDTWEAAHKYLLEKARERVVSATRRLDYETETLKKTEAMSHKEPMP